MKLLLSALLVVLASASASAADYPKHLFWCGLLKQSPAQQAYMEIADDALASGIATVVLSNMQRTADPNDGWKEFQRATNARVRLTWTRLPDGRRAIDSAELDLGRSGRISMRTTEKYDKFASAKGRVTASALGFNYPQGVEADYCTYVMATGTRPGVIGSN